MLVSPEIKKLIPRDIKHIVKNFIIKSFNILGIGAWAGKIANYSQFSEQTVIRKYVNKLNSNKYCVDIAASDGVCQSNTYALYLTGWNGLAVEYSDENFAKLSSSYKNLKNVKLAHKKVTPNNVVSILKENDVPKNFGVLNMDIDGYDHFVLEKILSEYRPSLICAEINEKIPVPIKFTVKWSDDFGWTGGHLYGQSLSKLCELADKNNYELVNLVYNNAFLIPKEINTFKSLTPKEAYDNGYLNKPDRKQKFPWDKDMEEALHLNPEKALEFINKYFEKDRSKYEISI